MHTKERKKSSERHINAANKYDGLEKIGKTMQPITRQKPYQLQYMEKLRENDTNREV